MITLHRDSPLGAWTYCEWRPGAAAPPLEVVWHFDGPTVSRRKRILPNGTFELLVNFAEPYRILAGRGPERLGKAWVGGLLTGPAVIEQPARQSVLGLRLRPDGAYALLATPMREVSGLQVDLDDVIGRAADELVEHCREAPSVERRLHRAAAWVLERIARQRGADASIAWAAAEIERSGGAVPIAALRAETGLSKARIAAAFREQIGVAPKLYARLVRFHHAARMLQRESTALVDVALACGYYDQPHMNTEFRELSGFTPTEFLAARHPVGDGTTAADAAETETAARSAA